MFSFLCVNQFILVFSFYHLHHHNTSAISSKIPRISIINMHIKHHHHNLFIIIYIYYSSYSRSSLYTVVIRGMAIHTTHTFRSSNCSYSVQVSLFMYANGINGINGGAKYLSHVKTCSSQ